MAVPRTTKLGVGIGIVQARWSIQWVTSSLHRLYTPPLGYAIALLCGEKRFRDGVIYLRSHCMPTIPYTNVVLWFLALRFLHPSTFLEKMYTCCALFCSILYMYMFLHASIAAFGICQGRKYEEWFEHCHFWSWGLNHTKTHKLE